MARWAIRPKGVGKRVGWRRLKENATLSDLVSGESFIYDADQPDKNLVLNGSADGVVVISASDLLSEIKQGKIMEAQALYEQKLYADYVFNGDAFHMGKQSQFNFAEADRAGGTHTFYEKDTYSSVSLNAANIDSIVGAIRTRTATLAGQMSTHVAAINALTTVAAVEDYDLTSGW